MTKVFIDGKAGTTGLKIYDRLEKREDISLITLSDELRKDKDARKEAINSADIVFLCLPDAAATESAEMCENQKTVIIDTSTAHRVDPLWTYGFPEIGSLREKIKSSKRIANPGCHASGFNALVAPLRENNVIPKTARLSCFSLTGYSGGGKSMIAEYTAEENGHLLAPRQYALGQSHKHLKEMAKVSNLDYAPCFCPVVGAFYSGMEVTVSLFKEDIKGSLKDICNIYKSYYKDGLVYFAENPDENGFLSAGSFSGFDDMEISAYGNDDRIILVSRFDNLGKGASGAAIQNMNIVLGADEKEGLKEKKND